MVMEHYQSKSNFDVVLLLLIMLLAIPSPAAAYIDPNTGNIIFQILFPIITAIATGYLLCKNVIRRKLKALKMRFHKKSHAENQNE